MSAKKITKEEILKTIKDEAYVIKRKKELYEELKKMNGELKNLNECRGMAGTFGFKMPGDVMNKTAGGTGFENPQDISHVAQLERDFGGFGDEFANSNTNEVTMESLKQENEALKKQLSELKSESNTAVSGKI